jgi:hypothetical protein
MRRKLRGVGGIHAKAAPLQALACLHGQRLNAEDDKDERELIPTGLSMSQIQLVHQLIIPKILDGAFSRDFTVLQ